jgi:hypothetical protein
MTTVTTSLFNPVVLARTDEVRAAFQAETPLPGFVIVPDLLSEYWLQEALAGCDASELSTWCGYAIDEDMRVLRNEFCEPREGPIYVTVHQRPVQPVPQLQDLHARFVAPSTLDALRELTGIPLKPEGHRSVLTSWGPWSFLTQHTDANRPNRLLVSLSLTRRWSPRFGGITGWRWAGVKETVWVEPHLNNAVLFAPFSGSDHWVEQIASDAPGRLRFTWTMEYE